VRYKEENGAAVYDSYYYPPNKGHSRGASAYSLAGSEYDGATPLGLYDPPSAGLLGTNFHEGLDFQDDNKGDDFKNHGYKDREDGHLLEPPSDFETPREVVEAGQRDAPNNFLQ